MLAWDWRSSGIMRKASLFVGPPRHRDLTLWAWPVLGEGIVLHFPTSFLLSRAVTHQRGGRKWLFIDEHAQELVEEESQSAGYNCLSWSRAIPQQPAWMLQSDSLPPPAARSTNLSAPWDGRFIVVLQLRSNLKVIYEWLRSSTEGRLNIDYNKSTHVVMNVVCKFLDYRLSMCLAKWAGVSC